MSQVGIGCIAAECDRELMPAGRDNQKLRRQGHGRPTGADYLLRRQVVRIDEHNDEDKDGISNMQIYDSVASISEIFFTWSWGAFEYWILKRDFRGRLWILNWPSHQTSSLITNGLNPSWPWYWIVESQTLRSQRDFPRFNTHIALSMDKIDPPGPTSPMNKKSMPVVNLPSEHRWLAGANVRGLHHHPRVCVVKSIACLIPLISSSSLRRGLLLSQSFRHPKPGWLLGYRTFLP
ncbi:hypothetical protein ACLOJK_032197 [Asimina triloba]